MKLSVIAIILASTALALPKGMGTGNRGMVTVSSGLGERSSGIPIRSSGEGKESGTNGKENSDKRDLAGENDAAEKREPRDEGKRGPGPAGTETGDSGGGGGGSLPKRATDPAGKNDPKDQGKRGFEAADSGGGGGGGPGSEGGSFPMLRIPPGGKGCNGTSNAVPKYVKKIEKAKKRVAAAIPRVRMAGPEDGRD